MDRLDARGPRSTMAGGRQGADYIAPDGKLNAASVTTSGATFQSGAPVALFPLRVAGGASNLFRPQYDVGKDGRFLVNQLVDESATPITLVLNWQPPDRTDLRAGKHSLGRNSNNTHGSCADPQ